MDVYVITISVLVILLIALLIYLIINFRMKKREQENYQRTFFASVIQILEFDRQRISKDLHDEIGTTLSIIKMNLGKMTKAPENLLQNKQLLDASADMLDTVITSTRQISQELMSPTLVKLGYERGMVELGKKISATESISVNVHINEFEQRLPQLVELEAYRVMQEVLNNIIRHAEANQIKIEITSSRDNVTTNVIHDGKGIDAKAVENLSVSGKGIGLKSIQKRLELIDAEIEYKKGNTAESPQVIVRIPRYETH